MGGTYGSLDTCRVGLLGLGKLGPSLLQQTRVGEEDVHEQRRQTNVASIDAARELGLQGCPMLDVHCTHGVDGRQAAAQHFVGRIVGGNRAEQPTAVEPVCHKHRACLPVAHARGIEATGAIPYTTLFRSDPAVPVPAT